MLSLKKRAKELTDTMASLFDNHCEFGLFPIKFHLLDHVSVIIWRNYHRYVIEHFVVAKFKGFSS